MEFMIRERLSWMRFFGLSLYSPMSEENTIRHFRNRMIEMGTLKRVMKAFDWQLKKKGSIPMAGRSLTQPWSQHPSNETSKMRRPRSKL